MIWPFYGVCIIAYQSTSLSNTVSEILLALPAEVTFYSPLARMYRFCLVRVCGCKKLIISPLHLLRGLDPFRYVHLFVFPGWVSVRGFLPI